MAMTTKNTGGPAQHMTLRDHFAGQAMAAIASLSLSPDEVAKIAYAIADAMLQERDK